MHQPHKMVRHTQNTLFKCPSGHQILNRRLKLNSRNSVEKYKNRKTHQDKLIFRRGAKQNFLDFYLDHFHYRLCFKKCKNSIKRALTLARTQSTKEASHDLPLMDNWQTFGYMSLSLRDIQLLLCHKMTRIWTPLLPTCPHLFDFGTPTLPANVLNFTSTPPYPSRKWWIVQFYSFVTTCSNQQL